MFSLVIIPMGLIAWLALDRPANRIDLMVRLIIVGATLVLLMSIGAWHWVGYYLRFVLATGYIVFVGVVLHRNRLLPSWSSMPANGYARLALFGAALVPILLLSGIATAGHRYDILPIDLVFPLRDGAYYIGEAGSTRLINQHLDYESEVYGIDVHKLNNLGMRARGILPLDNEDYEIYGEPIYSPCDGVVTRMATDHLDHAPGEPDEPAGGGNLIEVACDGVRITLAHMMHLSPRTAVGDDVVIGWELGRVGNSGKSTVPHLHIHAETTSGEGVPLLFNGRFLVRNMVVFVDAP